MAPSVVAIETVGGLERVGKMLIGSGPTTGLIVDKDGYIVSSAFNFVNPNNETLPTLPSRDKATADAIRTAQGLQDRKSDA